MHEAADPQVVDYLTHLVAGGVFAVSGAIARGMCRHNWHRWGVGTVLVALESFVVVQVAG